MTTSISSPTSRKVARRWSLGLLGILLGGGAALWNSQAATTAHAESRPASVVPELVGGAWLNTPNGQPLRLAARRGKVTVVEFWTSYCSNCRANLPAYARWQKQFGAQGLTVIGVHTPETAEERKP